MNNYQLTPLADRLINNVKRLKNTLRSFIVSPGGQRHRELLIIEHMEVDLVFSRLFEKKHLRIMDIGSHHGEFLDIFEQHNHPHTYSVTCVEPMPYNLKVLQSKINGYRRVQAVVCPVAISDVTETKTFFEGTADTLFTCDKSWVQENREYFMNPVEVKIDCLSMMDLAKKYNIDLNEPFDFIKIDTEGHDLNVIQSLLSANIKTFAVMFEIGYNLSDIIAAVELLTEHGFNEFYVFGRTGIHTLYIGEFKGSEQLHELRQQRRLNAGNMIAFHNENLVRE